MRLASAKHCYSGPSSCGACATPTHAPYAQRVAVRGLPLLLCTNYCSINMFALSNGSPRLKGHESPMSTRCMSETLWS